MFFSIFDWASWFLFRDWTSQFIDCKAGVAIWGSAADVESASIRESGWSDEDEGQGRVGSDPPHTPPAEGGGLDDAAGREQNTDPVTDKKVCGGGGKIGDRVLSATALKSTQQATNKDAAKRFIEVADTQENDNK